MNFYQKNPWSVVAAALLLVSASLFGQSTTGRLSGNVTTEGAPLPGVTVSVTAPTLQGERTTETDVNGNYNFGARPQLCHFA